MLVIFLVASFFIFANASPIPGNATADDIKNDFQDNILSHVNKTEENLNFRGTTIFKEDDIDVAIHYDNKTKFHGNKIDFDFTSNGTETDFMFKALVSPYGMTERFDIRVQGTVSGKKVNEKGKIMYKWDKVTWTFMGDADDGSVSATECVNPSVKTEGLSDEIVEKIKNGITVQYMAAWERFYRVNTEKETKFGKSTNACKKAKWTINA